MIFCIQTISKTPCNSKAWCIARIHLVFPKPYVPWPAYTSLRQLLTCSQKHCWSMASCAPWKISCQFFKIVVWRLSSSFWCFWDCINEMFFPPNIFVASCLCMVEGGLVKVWGDKYQMMCGIICFKGFGQIFYPMVLYLMVVYLIIH